MHAGVHSLCVYRHMHIRGVRREVCGPYVRCQVRTIRDIYCAGVPAFYQVNTPSMGSVDCNKAVSSIFRFLHNRGTQFLNLCGPDAGDVRLVLIRKNMDLWVSDPLWAHV